MYTYMGEVPLYGPLMGTSCIYAIRKTMHSHVDAPFSHNTP